MAWDAIKLIPMLSLMILSCEGGVEPDLFYAVFQRDNEKMVSIAKQIREYLR